MADAKQAEVNSGSSQARVVLAKPRLGGFALSSFGASSSNTESNSFGPVLRPPQLKPGNNPFLKVTNIEPENEKRNKIEPSKCDTEEDKEAPKFVPLGSTNVTTRTNNPVSAPGQPATSSSATFVFGQNLSERVVIKENVNNGEATIEHSSTNGTSELLFTSAAASVKEGNQEESVTNETTRSGEGLAAAAAEYERSHARPPPPPSTAITMTGEEGENNVLQISCRLYAWEAGSWRERGRGVLRLNDAAGEAGEAGAARLVARVAGSLRVVLNTKLWPDMVVEMAGTKSLRITAADAQQQVKLYLIMGAPGDIVQLHRALMARVANSKPINSSVSKHNATSQRAAERLEAATDDSEYIDRPDSEEVSNSATLTEHSENLDEEVDQVDSVECDRIDQKTEEDMFTADNGMNEDTENRPLKRKEPAEIETSPKRQCPEV